MMDLTNCVSSGGDVFAYLRQQVEDGSEGYLDFTIGSSASDLKIDGIEIIDRESDDGCTEPSQAPPEETNINLILIVILIVVILVIIVIIVCCCIYRRKRVRRFRTLPIKSTPNSHGVESVTV